MNKTINWFEIPALDLSRAKTFYEKILAVGLKGETLDGAVIEIFPYDRGSATGGCLVHSAEYKPSRDGAVVYLNAGESIDAVLGRVKSAGGDILVPKTALPPGHGFYAHILDTEGNRVGLHQMSE